MGVAALGVFRWSKVEGHRSVGRRKEQACAGSSQKNGMLFSGRRIQKIQGLLLNETVAVVTVQGLRDGCL